VRRKAALSEAIQELTPGDEYYGRWRYHWYDGWDVSMQAEKRGNNFFKDKQWDTVAEHYTKCIHVALFQLNKRSSNDNDNINTYLLHAYSNRAETRLHDEGI